MSEYNERVLEDDYPIHFGYLYVVGGRPFQNITPHKTVGELRDKLVSLKIEEPEVEIKSCDIAGRDLWEFMQ